MERAEPRLTSLLAAAFAVGRRPWLWRVALTQTMRVAPSGWWRRWPPLPRPDASYLRFRKQTQYGDPGHATEPRDLVDYLEWCRTQRRYLG